MNYRNKSGFTLVELMVVAVIVAVLAAVAIPLMMANVKRAKTTEADSGCGAVRTALRVYYAEHQAYPAGTDSPVTAIPGVGANDLDGVYFSTPDYTYTVVGNNYTIKCTGNSAGSVAPKKSEAGSIVVTLDQSGSFVRTGL
ncbi:MAG: prepilin-type N-terminal cleavage/methylation domain-containing protein [bacterium]